MGGRPWTEEEIRYLEDNWAVVSFKGMSKHLGRSIDALKVVAGRRGLGDVRLQTDGITLSQLSHYIGVSYSVLKGWVKKYDFPVKRKILSVKHRIRIVDYDDFWKWAEANKQMINFAKMERNILGVEPGWVEEKRKADQIKNLKIKKGHRDAWTPSEDLALKSMLNAYRYTYPEIAQSLKRSEGAVKRRILDLGIKARPVRLNNHIKYTDEEVQLMVGLYDKGHCLEDIAERLNKSALGVRGKFERMGYRFKNGVPVKKE